MQKRYHRRTGNANQGASASRALGDDHDPRDRKAAFARAIETDPFPLGVIYINEKPTFEENLGLYAEGDAPLPFRSLERGEKLRELMKTKV